MENKKILYKYPRTPHLPWSPGRDNDDKVLQGIEHFKNKELVGSIKMDGENTTLYRDHIHARSLDSGDHESRHWVKSFHASIKHLIPIGWRICGENLYAKHSIYYTELESYFYGFSVWNDKNICLSWPETEKFLNDLGIILVPVFAVGTVEEIDTEFHNRFNDKETEGYVVRLKDAFKYEEFNRSVAKYVRVNHVQTDSHWMHQKLVKNKLKK